MDRKEFEEKMKAIEAIHQAIEDLNNLIIDWETDISKMDFQALRTKTLTDDVSFQELTIGSMNPNTHFSESHWSESIRAFMIDPNTKELIDFVKNKNKIIPPMRMELIELFYDDTTTSQVVSDIAVIDGSHRLFLSKILGIVKIPTVDIRRVSKFTFPLDKWKFDFVDDYFIARNKSTNEQIKLNAKRLHIDDGGALENNLVITRY